MKIIEVQDLHKTFSHLMSRKKVRALRGVNLEVSKGQIFGLLGPNGAGKTTLVKILLGICYSNAGQANLFGHPVRRAASRADVGYLPESHKYPRFLTGEQVLDYYGKLSGMNGSVRKPRIEMLLNMVRMKGWEKIKMGKYSKGMQQRVGLAASMVSDPELLVLDEPTDGVDPIGRKEIRDVLLELKNRGKTIFLNSHMLGEVEMICDHVAILHQGQVIREGSIKDLTDLGNLWSVSLERVPENYIEKLKERGVPSHFGKENELLLELQDLNSLNAAIDSIRHDGLLISDIHRKRQTLEDIFYNVISETTVGGAN